MVPFKLSKERIQQILAYILLGAAALLSLAYPFKLALGIDLFISSVFTLLTLRVFGWKPALAQFLIVHAAGVNAFHEPLLMAALSLIELAAAALWLSRRPDGILIPTIAVWLAIGIPAILLGYRLSEEEIGPLLMLHLTIRVINKSFNALVADICYKSLPFLRNRNESRIRLSGMLLELTIFSIIGSAFLFVLNTGKIAEQNMTASIQQEADAAAATIRDSYSHWTEEERQAIQLRSLLQLGYLSEIIRTSTSIATEQAALFNEQGMIIRSFHFNEDTQPVDWLTEGGWNRVSDSLYRWERFDSLYDLPGSYLRNTFFIYELKLSGLIIYVHLSSEKYIQEAVLYYVSQSFNVLYMALTIGLFSLFLHRFILLSIRRLVNITTDLPQRMKSGRQIDWFPSNIEEIHLLIQNISLVTQQLKQMLGESKEQANLDMLTGLANRRHFNEFIVEAVERAVADESCAALMFIDLDRFKPVNDKYGHAAGDELLRQVAGRLSAMSGQGTFAARLGGDEFVLVIMDTNPHATDMLAFKVREALETPFEIDGHQLHIGGSIGIAMIPSDGEDADTVVKHADMAMYAAKQQRDGAYRFYADLKGQSVFSKPELLAELKMALDNKELMLHYQPIVDLAAGRIVKVEALARWQHREHGWISPLEFIPAAEKGGLMGRLGEHVLIEACNQIMAWRDLHDQPISITINLSKSQLAKYEAAACIERVLEETGISPNFIEVEVTEEVFAEDYEPLLQALNRLKRMGIRIWLDDFGTGYSSLHMLHLLPIDGLKLDRAFVHRLSEEPARLATVRTIVALARNQGLAIIGEGVEQPEEEAILLESGCTLQQGYYHGQPMTAMQITEKLRTAGR